MKHRATIKIPRCWKRLVQEVFEETDGGLIVEGTDRKVRSEKTPHRNESPEAFYDDCRTVAALFPNGMAIDIDLCSGQGNYYGGVTIQDEDEVLYESEPLETFDDEMDFPADDGDTYIVKVEWTGTDPYEKEAA